jgi:cephalosporin hydroxylase
VIANTDNTRTVRWLGKTIWQHPNDAWLIQEMIVEQSPDLIVETGTYMGGSAYFFASICEQLGRGRIISIDIDPVETIEHPRITYMTGRSSVDPDVVREVHDAAASAERVFVVLDSDHSAPHVLAELEAFASLVPVGGYVHVQDGLIDEHSVFGETEPGPAAAVKEFLAAHPEFVRDQEVESRYIVTAHPYGWLRRAR